MPVCRSVDRVNCWVTYGQKRGSNEGELLNRLGDPSLSDEQRQKAIGQLETASRKTRTECLTITEYKREELPQLNGATAQTALHGVDSAQRLMQVMQAVLMLSSGARFFAPGGIGSTLQAVTKPLSQGVLLFRGVSGLANNKAYSDDKYWQQNVSRYVYPTVLLLVGLNGLSSHFFAAAGSNWARMTKYITVGGLGFAAFSKFLDARAWRRTQNRLDAADRAEKNTAENTTDEEFQAFATQRNTEGWSHFRSCLRDLSDLLREVVPDTYQPLAVLLTAPMSLSEGIWQLWSAQGDKPTTIEPAKNKENYVKPWLDCYVKVGEGEDAYVKHVVIDEEGYQTLSQVSPKYKIGGDKLLEVGRSITVMELVGRVIKFAEPWLCLLYGATFFARGRWGAVLKDIRQVVGSVSVFAKGANYAFNPLGRTDETGFQRDFFKAVCPWLMMIMGVNGILKFAVGRFERLGLFSPSKAFMQTWNGFGSKLGLVGSGAAAAFMWTNSGTSNAFLTELEGATYLGGKTSKKDFEARLEAVRNERFGNRLDTVKYMGDFADNFTEGFLPDGEAKLIFQGIHRIPAVIKSAYDVKKKAPGIAKDLRERFLDPILKVDERKTGTTAA